MNNDIFLKNVAILSKVSEEEERATPAKGIPLPSVEALRDIVELVKVIVFPGFFDRRQTDSNIRSYHIGVNMERCSNKFALLCSPKRRKTAEQAREMPKKWPFAS